MWTNYGHYHYNPTTKNSRALIQIWKYPIFCFHWLKFEKKTSFEKLRFFCELQFFFCIIKMRLFESRPRGSLNLEPLWSKVKVYFSRSPIWKWDYVQQMWFVNLHFNFLNREFIHTVQNSRYQSENPQSSIHLVLSPERINVGGT